MIARTRPPAGRRLATILLALFAVGSPGLVAAAEADVVAGSSAATVATSAPSAAEWDGSIDLYRRGAFTTQKTWQWCTAAGVQIVRNIVEDDDDHSRGSQARYYAWMRDHNRYDLPDSAGVDPAGWTAGLRQFVDDRYRLVASRSFGAALRSAVANLRRTNLPVAITVAHGGHGWILTGFDATADPLVTDDFEVERVRVVGPLYGRQSRDGYDMPPNTELTVRQLRRFLTAWRYEPLPMIWDGRFVTIQPVADGPIAPTPKPTPKPIPMATPTPPGPLWLAASDRATGHR